MKVSCKTMVLIALVLFTLSEALEFKPGLLTVSAGSWIALPANKEPLYFSKMAMTAYSTISGVKVVPNIPLAWTYESGSKKQRLFPGDGSLYIGKRIGQFEPRLGIIIPLGYASNDQWKKEAWIGTNNIKAQVGLAYGRAEEALEGMPLSIEAMVSVPVTEKNAYLLKGSVSAIAFGKTYWRVNEQLRWGAELMVLASRSVWAWTYEVAPGVQEQVIETSLGTVPNAWAEYHLTGAWYCSVKAGFGPNFKTSNENRAFIHSGNSLNVSTGVQWYP